MEKLLTGTIPDTRMHSSGMHTARSLPYGGGGLCPERGSLSSVAPPLVNRMTDRKV